MKHPNLVSIKPAAAQVADKTRDKPALKNGFQILEVDEAIANDKTAEDWVPPARVN
jgi:hypothetical protein